MIVFISLNLDHRFKSTVEHNKWKNGLQQWKDFAMDYGKGETRSVCYCFLMFGLIYLLSYDCSADTNYVPNSLRSTSPPKTSPVKKNTNTNNSNLVDSDEFNLNIDEMDSMSNSNDDNSDGGIVNTMHAKSTNYVRVNT